MNSVEQVHPDALPRERGGPLDVWAAGVGVALRTLRKEPVLGLKRLALPVSYWRSAEFGYVWRQLSLPAGARVLDVGSPKDLAAMLAYRRGYEVVATDILPEAIESSRRYAIAQSLDGVGPGRVRSEVQDGRTLEYADGSFDAAFSVSVLEHIPDDGDSKAMGELMRVCVQAARLWLRFHTIGSIEKPSWTARCTNGGQFPTNVSSSSDITTVRRLPRACSRLAPAT
jgi:SAM-dependent methyltransferase